MDKVSYIELTEADLIGTGTRRICYAYPGNNELCIKVPKQTKGGSLQQRREVKYYNKLAKRQVPTGRITQYHYPVKTNFGDGYVYDVIRDHNGEYSQQFMYYLKNEPERIDEYLSILKELESYFFDNNVLFYDLNPYNILCRQSSDNKLEPFVIDGVGEVVAIPILNISRHLVRKKIARRWMRFINKLKIQFDWMEAYSPEYRI